MSLAIYTSAAWIANSGLQVADNATIEVRRESDGALASIFSDREGAAPITNPSAFGDAFGRFQFFAAGGAYRVKVTQDGQEYTLRYQAIGTAGELDQDDLISPEEVDQAIGVHAEEEGGIHGIPEGERAYHTGDALLTDTRADVGVRQTVLAGPTDAIGRADFLEASSASLTISTDLDGGTLYLTAANGYGPGPLNETWALESDVSWTVPDDATSYLIVYPDNSTDVTATYTEGRVFPATPTTDDRHYLTDDRLYRWDGAEWVADVGVVVGEATAAGGAVTETVSYEYLPTRYYHAPLLHVVDEKASGANGGGSVSGAEQDRDLNTVLTDEIGVTVASPEIQGVPPGVYYVEASAPAFNSTRHRAYLYSVSTAGDLLYGTSEFSGDSAQSTVSRSFVSGVVEISGNADIKIVHYTDNAMSSNGLGIATNDGNPERYTELKMWRIA